MDRHCLNILVYWDKKVCSDIHYLNKHYHHRHWQDQTEIYKKTALTSLEELNAAANDSKAGTEETGLDTVEKDNWGKSKLFNLKDTAIL